MTNAKHTPSCAVVESVAGHYRDIIKSLGEDPSREGLMDTPMRAAKAMSFLTSGYSANVQEIVGKALFKSDASEIVLIRDIELYSMCEHHMLPFFGKCHVAYIPNGKVIGLSKVPRIVDVYARRLQIQENLTTQVAQTLMEVLQPHGVAVVMEAYHLCMMMRGVEKQNSKTVTSAMLGAFREDEKTRKEFLSLLSQREILR